MSSIPDAGGVPVKRLRIDPKTSIDDEIPMRVFVERYGDDGTEIGEWVYDIDYPDTDDIDELIRFAMEAISADLEEDSMGDELALTRFAIFT